jgi:hypothetical protein
VAGLIAEGDLFYDLSPLVREGLALLIHSVLNGWESALHQDQKRQTVDYGKKFPWTNAFKFRTF